MHVRMFHIETVEKPLVSRHRCFCQCVPFMDPRDTAAAISELSTNPSFW